MNLWITLWQNCLLFSLVAFTVMAIIVTIGGAMDIKKMLKKLSEDEQKSISR